MLHHVLTSLPSAHAVDTLCPKCGSRTLRIEATASLHAQVTFAPEGTRVVTDLRVPGRDQTWTDTAGARCVRCAHTAPLSAFQQPRTPVTLERLRLLAGQPPAFDAPHCLAVLMQEGLTSLSDAALPAAVEEYRISRANRASHDGRSGAPDDGQDEFCID